MVVGIKAFMDTILDWKLIYRSPAELLQLIHASTFGQKGKPYYDMSKVVTGCNPNPLSVLREIQVVMTL